MKPTNPFGLSHLATVPSPSTDILSQPVSDPRPRAPTSFGEIRPSGPCPARVMIVGEYPGEQEVARGEPFVGTSGQELNKLLAEAGFSRSECFVTSVIRQRPPNNDITLFIPEKKSEVTDQHILVNDRYVLPCVHHGIELLRQEIALCRPTMILAFGNIALWALTGEWGITKWRGSVLPCALPTTLEYKPKVIATYAPSAIFRQMSWRPVLVMDLRRAKVELARGREVVRPAYNFHTRPDFDTVMSIVQQLSVQASRGPITLAVDIETRARHTACIGFAWSKLDALCIPLMCVENGGHYWTEDEESTIIFALIQLFSHPNTTIVGQNFLYDAQYFYRDFHFLPNLRRDTMLAQHVIFPSLPKGLDFLASMYCEDYYYWKDEGKEWNANIDEDQLWVYNCRDAVNTYEVDLGQQTAVDKLGVRAVHDFQQRLFWPVLRTMLRGIRVDHAARGTIAGQLMEAIAEREQWLIDVLGHPINIKSPKQMATLFYGDLGFRAHYNRKSGTITCNDEALQLIAEREPLVKPLVSVISDLRSLGVFLSTFVNAPCDIDGRMRCSFNIAGTDTYRFSSSGNAFGSGMNLQNIPKGGDTPAGGLVLPNVRKFFIPDPGNVFFDIDLSSADLRIVVWESDETEMKRMLAEGLDPYTEIAKEFYHDPSITKKDPRRQTFKSFAHGTNYLGTAKGLAERLGLSVHEAEKTQRWYFSRFPRIAKWQKDLKDQVLKRRFVENAFGYRFYFLERIEGTVFNQAAAWIPQSTVACLINRAYVAIDEQLPEVEILLQVHDSLAGQFPAARREHFTNEILRLSHITIPYSDPLVIPVGMKSSELSWGDCD